MNRARRGTRATQPMKPKEAYVCAEWESSARRMHITQHDKIQSDPIRRSVEISLFYEYVLETIVFHLMVFAARKPAHASHSGYYYIKIFASKLRVRSFARKKKHILAISLGIWRMFPLLITSSKLFQTSAGRDAAFGWDTPWLAEQREDAGNQKPKNWNDKIDLRLCPLQHSRTQFIISTIAWWCFPVLLIFEKLLNFINLDHRQANTTEEKKNPKWIPVHRLPRQFAQLKFVCLPQRR